MRGRSTQQVSTNQNFAKVVPYVSDSEHRRNSKNSKMMRGGHSEHEEFEYYTSEDGVGNPVKKLRKKKRENGSKGPRVKKMHPAISKGHDG